MAVTVHESARSRDHRVSPRDPAATVELFAFGDQDDAAVRAAVIAWLTTNAFDPYPGTALRVTAIDVDAQGGGFWVASVQYALPEGIDLPGTTLGPDPISPPPPPPPPTPGQHDALGPAFSFSTLGGTGRMFTGRNLVFSDVVGGGSGSGAAVAPDFGGAMSVQADGTVEGCEVVVPRVEWKVTVQAKEGYTMAYIRTLEELTGTVNVGTFFHHDDGEVLFLGADGNYRDGEGGTVTYHFLGGKTVAPYTVGGVLSAPELRPHQFAWVRYRDEADPASGRTVQRPYALYVHDVYESRDFADLEIGGA